MKVGRFPSEFMPAVGGDAEWEMRVRKKGGGGRQKERGRKPRHEHEGGGRRKNCGGGDVFS